MTKCAGRFFFVAGRTFFLRDVVLKWRIFDYRILLLIFVFLPRGPMSPIVQDLYFLRDLSL